MSSRVMYYIRDTETNEYLANKAGAPVCYTHRRHALDAAARTEPPRNWWVSLEVLDGKVKLSPAVIKPLIRKKL